VIVLGGGMSGISAAYTLVRAGFRDVTIIERGMTLGGLAGSFEREGHFYPLGYHHILHRDQTLLFFLEQIGGLRDVRWRRIRMLFEAERELHDLGTPIGFLRFPMRASDKLRFLRLMLRAFAKSDWSDWMGRSAEALVDEWAGPGVRAALFEPLCRLKFDLPCEEVSGAWLGARLHFREGSAPLGYIPKTNWTTVLCDGLTRLIEGLGVRLRLQTAAVRLHARGGRMHEAEFDNGERIGADVFVSTLPTEVYLRLAPEDRTPHLASIRYTALLSMIGATRQEIRPDAYWINLGSRRHTACAIFLLHSLNPTIGKPGDACVNFITHLQGRDDPRFRTSEEELAALFQKDFRNVFGFPFEPFWTHLSRIPMYSPIFRRDFQNPPVRSQTWRNLYFAGNYRTFPSIASTGTALRSGIDAGAAILAEHDASTDLLEAIGAFRRRLMPRAEKANMV
jgi:protoporphyrinogen oxidase